MSSDEDRLVGETEHFYVYDRYVDGNLVSHGQFMKLKEPLWFLRPTAYVLEQHCGGVRLDQDNIERFESLFGRNIVEGYYYMSAACSGGYADEAVKWIFGPIITEMNKSSRKISHVCPAPVLREFVTYLSQDRFPKHHAKDVFEAILKRCPVYTDIPAILDEIIADPRFAPVDTNAVETAVAAVIVALPEKVEEAKANPKLIQWLVGQVLKANKGMSPVLVKEALEKAIV